MNKYGYASHEKLCSDNSVQKYVGVLRDEAEDALNHQISLFLKQKKSQN